MRHDVARNAGLIALILFVTTLSTPAAGAATEAAQAPETYREVLDNGLEVIVYADHSLPVVSVNVWYRVGSRDEVVGKRGLAHLLEHMMFKGTTNVAPEEHSRLIAEVGGVSNAFTTADVTGYWQNVTSDHLEMVLRLEADRMANLVITEEKLATEREVVKEEYRLRLQNDPVGRAYDAFQAQVLAGTPYAWTPAGNIDDLDQVTVADLEAFYRTYYVPNNAVLVIAGDAEPETAFALARRYFGHLEARPLPPKAPFELPDAGSSWSIELNLPIQLPVIVGGYLIPGVAHEDIPALEIASLILSAGQSSRMYRSLVREQQVAVAAAGSASTYKDVGLFRTLALYTPDRSAEEVQAAMLGVISELATHPPTEMELEKARNQILAGRTFQLDSMRGVAEGLAAAAVYLDDYRQFYEELAEYERVTAEDVVRVVETYLRPERFAAVQVTPQSESGSDQP